MRVSRPVWSAVLLGVMTMLPGAGWAAGKCERLIVTGSPDSPPYLWRDPQDPRHLMGANADLLGQALKELGIAVEFLYAGKRSQAQEEVRSGRMDMLVDAPLNTAWLDDFDYIHPAATHNEIVVWVRADTQADIQVLEDLHGLAGAVSQRTRLSPEFESVAAGQLLQLQRTAGLTQALQKLVLGEVDYVLAGRYAAMVMAQALGLQNNLQALPVVVDRPGSYLALSFNSACLDPWLRGQLVKKMTESAASGFADEAVRRNLGVWKSQLLAPVSKQ